MYNNIIWIYHVHRLPHMYICWKREKCVIFLKIAVWKYDHQCQYVFKHTIKQEAGENQFFILKTILWTAISAIFNTIFKKVLRSKNKPTMLLIKKRIWNGHIFNKKEQNNMLLPTFLVYFCYMNWDKLDCVFGDLRQANGHHGKFF